MEFRKKTFCPIREQVDVSMKDGGATAFANDVAELTGLEPATSSVTGKRSNQLSYSSRKQRHKRSVRLQQSFSLQQDNCP